MENTATPTLSIMGLVRALKNDTRQLFRQELELAKAELSEKFSVFARNAAVVAAGGFIAYAGLIVFLMSLGWLVAWALQQAGLQPVLAGFLGLAIVGLVIGAVGAGLLFKGLKTFSTESMAPQRTIRTIQRLKGSETPRAMLKQASEQLNQHRPSSAEMQTRVEETEDRMGDTLNELGHRLSPKRLNAKVKQRIQQKPYRSGLVAMGAGLLSGLFLTRSARGVIKNG